LLWFIVVLTWGTTQAGYFPQSEHPIHNHILLMASRTDVVDFLDHLLDVHGIPGDKSANGLQVEGAAEITKLAGSVDACAAVYDEVAACGAQMLFVHHGEFWGPGVRSVTGRIATRFGKLLHHRISLYAAHLPLDADRDFGHNACLADLLGLRDRVWFAKYAGVEIGVHGDLPESMSIDGLCHLLDEALATSCTALRFGKETLSRVAVISGAGSSALETCAALGIDALVTGEYGHTDYHVAKELGINLIAAGHYATETPGVHAVLEILADEFDLETVFIDHPTGL
jgi:dinuclear metal center YbgI/SA1388 family protein